jgi:hypothetical protein
LKESDIVKFSFLPDDHDAARLPRWVKTAKQPMAILLSSQANDALLATLDGKIPRAFLIPVGSKPR